MYVFCNCNVHLIQVEMTIAVTFIQLVLMGILNNKLQIVGNRMGER